VTGFWQNDRLNGLARRKAPGQQEGEQVIYKNDMLIMANSSGVNGCECFYVIFSIFMMLGVYAAAPLAIFLKEDGLYGIFGCYLIYAIYSCCTSSTKYINNLCTL